MIIFGNGSRQHHESVVMSITAPPLARPSSAALTSPSSERSPSALWCCSTPVCRGCPADTSALTPFSSSPGF
jgi:hypothetical protein